MTLPDAGVARSLDEVEPVASAVTIGNFDGVHRGHQVLLRRVVEVAADAGVRAVAITFDPHPAAVLRPGSEPPILQTLDDRVAALKDAGVGLVVVLPFTLELSRLTPLEFVDRVLVERLRTTSVIVGANFRFGHRAAGDVGALTEAGEARGFTTEAVAVRDLDGIPLSSSAIRSRLADGDVVWVTRALGRPHRVTGEVVAGDGRGRTIGVPTANVVVDTALVLPADGVYAGHATVDGVAHPTVTNLGFRPTFEGTSRTVETHLLDFDEDLYGRQVTVSFVERLRGERRFDGIDELVAQIRGDIDAARAALDVR